MINLINGYCIDVDPLNYTLKKLTKVDETGKKTYRTFTYHSNLQGAVSKSLDLMTREELEKGEHELVDAIAVMQKNQSKFEELLQQAIANFNPADIRSYEESEEE